MQTTHANHPSVKLIAAFDRGDFPAVVEVIAPTARAYMGNMDVDREGWKQFGRMWSAAFPDTKHEIIACHVAGEYATVVCKLRATHKGDFMGIPATGRAITMDVIHVDRVVDGRIVEHRGQFDSAGLMQQLAPAPQDVRPLVDQLFAAIDGQRLAEARELVAPHGTFKLGAMTLDRDGWREFSKGFFAAFPDGKHSHEVRPLGHDSAIEIGHFTGTHKGPFQGMPATGKKIDFSYIGITTFKDGKVVEQRVEADFATLMQQLQS